MTIWLTIPGVEVRPLPDRANEVKLPGRTHGLPVDHMSSFEVRTWAAQRSRRQSSLEQLTERMRVAGKRARYVFVSDVKYREFDVKRRWWLRWLGPIHREQAYCYAAIVPVSMQEIDAMIYENLVKPYKEALSEPPLLGPLA